MVRTPLGFNACEMKFGLVHGRREELQSTPERAAKIHAYEDSSFKIMSFDSLAEELRNRTGLYICSRANSYIRFLSKEYVDDTFLSWMEPEHIALTDELAEAIQTQSFKNSHGHRNGKLVNIVNYALERVNRIKDRGGQTNRLGQRRKK